MASIDFPDSPSLNQTFSLGSRSWKWDGSRWVSVYGANAKNLTNLDSNLVPSANITYDLGTAEKSWRDIYLSGNTINLGGQTITADESGIILPEGSKVGNISLGTGVTQLDIDNAIANLVSSAPESLNTLNELAAALGDDANFATTVTNSLAAKANSADLATVATSGSYGDLLNQPSLFSGSYNDLTDQPTLFSGSYNDLTDKPEASAGITVYTDAADLPLTGNTAGDMAYVTASNKLFLYTGTAWWNVGFTNAVPTDITGNDATYLLATDGTPTVITLTSTDPDGVELTWSSSSTDIGTIATVTNVDNVFTITPSANEADDGVFTLTFAASDGENIRVASSVFTLQIAVPVDWTDMFEGYGNVFADYTSVGAANPYINNTTAVSNGGSSNNNHISLWMTHASPLNFRKIRFGGHTSQNSYPFIFIYACPRQNGIADLNNNLIGSYRTNPVTNTISGNVELNLSLTSSLGTNATVSIPANYIFAIVVHDFYYCGRRYSTNSNHTWTLNGDRWLTQMGRAFYDCGGKGTSYLPTQMGGTRTVAVTTNIPLLTPADFV